jgi:hypothetical protein
MDLIPPEITGAARSRLLAALEDIVCDYREKRIGRRKALRTAATAYLTERWSKDLALWVARFARWARLKPLAVQTSRGVVGYFAGMEPAVPSPGPTFRPIPEDQTAREVAEEYIADLLAPPDEPGTKKPTAKRSSERYPRRAQWLEEKLEERYPQHGSYDLEIDGGPHHETTARILEGLPVRRQSLQKLAKALSVQTIDIPKD